MLGVSSRSYNLSVYVSCVSVGGYLSSSSESSARRLLDDDDAVGSLRCRAIFDDWDVENEEVDKVTDSNRIP